MVEAARASLAGLQCRLGNGIALRNLSQTVRGLIFSSATSCCEQTTDGLREFGNRDSTAVLLRFLASRRYFRVLSGREV